jgi:hypothetical protein
MKDIPGHILTIGFAMTGGLASQIGAALHSLLTIVLVAAVSGAVGFFTNRFLKKHFK